MQDLVAGVLSHRRVFIIRPHSYGEVLGIRWSLGEARLCAARLQCTPYQLRYMSRARRFAKVSRDDAWIDRWCSRFAAYHLIEEWLDSSTERVTGSYISIAVHVQRSLGTGALQDDRVPALLSTILDMGAAVAEHALDVACSAGTPVYPQESDYAIARQAWVEKWGCDRLQTLSEAWY